MLSTHRPDLYDVDFLVNYERVGRGFRYQVRRIGKDPNTGEPWDDTLETTTALTKSSNSMDPRLWEELLTNLSVELEVPRADVGAVTKPHDSLSSGADEHDVDDDASGSGGSVDSRDTSEEDTSTCSGKRKRKSR
jgi:hypothetical protein